MQSQTYDQVKARLKPGDVVAFAGANPLSTAIMKLGKADVSHVGIIVSSSSPLRDAEFIEATVRLEGREPTLVARVTDFPDRIDDYHGRVWWLPLSPAKRATFRASDFKSYVDRVEGTPFDLVQGTANVLKTPFDILNSPFQARSGAALYCSELVVGALHAGGVVRGGINPSATMPGDVCSWQIYDPGYALLKGLAGSIIKKFNSVLLAA